jgi:coenzyme F420-reducing hydrogenase delta subunit
MCTGRVDPTHVLRAFSNGVDGVFVGGCWLGECHYLTDGNHSAVSMMHMTRKLLKHIGINPERLTLDHVSAAQGNRFADLISDFTAKLKGIGRLGAAEGIDEERLKIGLEAATSIVPFMRLVERERLRVHFQTREEYAQFFESEETERLFSEMVIDKLALKEVLLMLRDGARSPAEIGKLLGVTPVEVARHLQNAARQRLAQFDEEQKRFALV